VSIFGLFKGREDRTLLRALGVIDEVLPERAELTVHQYTEDRFAANLKDHAN
jgi:hypothetical protein